MKNEDFKISFKTVWILVIGSYIVTGIGLFARLQHWGFSEFILGLGLMLYFSTCIIIIGDIIKHKIYSKSPSVITMFFIPIATILYMIQREKLIELNKK